MGTGTAAAASMAASSTEASLAAALSLAAAVGMLAASFAPSVVRDGARGHPLARSPMATSATHLGDDMNHL
jgi:hypothetical protein